MKAKQPDPRAVKKGLRRIVSGEGLDPLKFVEELVEVGYRKVGTVTERGEVARRGGIVDLFPTQSDVPGANGVGRGPCRVDPADRYS